MNQGLRRTLFVTGIILVVVAAIVYGFLPKTRTVDLARATRGSLQLTIEEEGRTRLKERFVVSAPTAGYMRRINGKVGDPVKKGQTLAVLEPLRSQALDPRSRAEAKAAVSAAEAALNAAKEKERSAIADVDYIEKRFERIRRLYAKRYVAKDQFDQIESEVKKAQALHRSAEAAVNMARSDLERSKAVLRNFSSSQETAKRQNVEITSPVNGTIFKIYRESEGAVNVGEPLMDVGNSKNLEVRVEVLSSDAVKIKSGMAVLFKRWGHDEPLEGTVRRVEPAGFTKVSSLGVEEQRVLIIADITSPYVMWRGLGDGYRMEAHFIVWRGENILQVPTSALFRVGKKWAVFVDEKGKARLRTVEAGKRTALTTEIISGLKENERVVAYPDESVEDGVRIQQRK